MTEHNVIIDIQFRVTAEDFVQMAPAQAEMLGRIVSTLAGLACSVRKLDAEIARTEKELQDALRVKELLQRLENRVLDAESGTAAEEKLGVE